LDLGPDDRLEPEVVARPLQHALGSDAGAGARLGKIKTGVRNALVAGFVPGFAVAFMTGFVRGFVRGFVPGFLPSLAATSYRRGRVGQPRVVACCCHQGAASMREAGCWRSGRRCEWHATATCGKPGLAKRDLQKAGAVSGRSQPLS